MRFKVASLATTMILALVQTASSAASSDAPAKQDWAIRILRSQCSEILAPVRAASDAGNIGALETLAVMYDRGCGVNQNMPQARRMFVTAIHSGANDANALGYVALYGSSSGNETAGVPLLKKAIHDGNVFAAQEIAFFYCLRYASKSDDVAAFHWNSVASQKGDLTARAQLGYDLVYGVGTTADATRGKTLIEETLAANVPYASFALASFSIGGARGYQRDSAAGFDQLRKATSTGSAFAKLLVGRMLEGDTVHDRYLRDNGFALVSEGASELPALPWVHAQLGSYMLASDNESLWDRGCNLLKEGGASPDGFFDYQLAYCYSNGRGFRADPKISMTYLRMAARKGYRLAINNLKNLAAEKDCQNNGCYSSEAAARAREDDQYHYDMTHHPDPNVPLPGSPADPNNR